MSCAVSECEIDPGSCASELEPYDIFRLGAVAALPVLISILLPILEHCRGCNGSRGCVAAAPSHDMRGFPLSYLRNGMLAVMVALVAGFLGIFFAVLTDVDEDTHIGPCEWGVGGCSTISCIAGTYKPQVYTYMMVMLVLSAVLGVTLLEHSRAATDADNAVDDESKKVRRWQQIVITVAQIFMSLIVLTGIFPAEYATNPEESLTLIPDTTKGDIASARFKIYDKLHVTGVVMLLVPFLLSTTFFTWKFFRIDAASRRRHWPSLAIRLVYVAISIAWFGLFQYYLKQARPDTLDYCEQLSTNRTVCENWLKPTSGQRPTTCSENFTVVAYTCTYRSYEDTLLSRLLHKNNAIPREDIPREDIRQRYSWEDYPGDIDKMLQQLFMLDQLLPMQQNKGTCFRGTCRLWSNALSIALEFGALLLPLAYLFSFGIPDLGSVEGPAHKAKKEKVDGESVSDGDGGGGGAFA